jgi:site-specific DNA recombinase
MTGPRFCIYARQSITGQDEQGDSLSIQSQIQACHDYAARQGGTVIGVFADPDQKGWRTSRPEFDRMLRMVGTEPGVCVLVFKLSRFMRSLMDQERFVGEIAAAGAELASVMEPYISTSPMVRQILGAVNEQYRRDQADFLKAAWRERARRGIHHGGAPYGYRMVDGKLEVDEAQAATVREMFGWALAGHGSPEIAARLNERGVPVPRGGGQWYEERVLGILRRPVYCGRIVLNGDVITEDGIHEPLIPPDTFDAAQRILDARRGTRRKEAPSWADGFVEHACGRRMYATRHHDGREDRGWRYRCSATVPSRASRGERCDVRPASMMAGKIERRFLDLLMDALDRVLAPEAVARQIEAGHEREAAERDRERQRLARRVDTIAGQRDRLLDLTLRGAVDEDAYRVRDAALRAELDAAKGELSAVPGPVDAARLATTHAALLDARTALPLLARWTPEELPAQLNALDVRLVIGAGPARLRWNGETAAFFAG